MVLEAVGCRPLMGIPGVKRPLGRQDVDGRIILKWILVGRLGLDLSGSG